ncbi:MAG: hypothetical protein MJZ41_14585 [Bacteroidaceae bacterium]|nr:hypothetical protein [Bacteroidaceae bacterium]
MKYLYGAAVQGIQQFIFQTNKLKDIVEASDRVQNICTEKFKKVLGHELNDDNAVLNAAGNVKYIFDTKEECERTVRLFPKTVKEYAPGITISQAVVPCPEDEKYAEYADELERRLRQQRNKPMGSLTTGLMAVLRETGTNLPKLVLQDEEGKEDTHDIKSDLCKNAFGEGTDMRDVEWEIEKMTDKNDWIAVIHADGNGLGQVVQKIGKDRKAFKEFSRNLDAATKAAAQRAYRNVFMKFADKELTPIRPIVLGGDDLTVICRADLALEYVTAFIDAFEKEAKEKTNQPLTACAGIAYIKSSFPFYYGYGLAESLCGEAKKDAKKDMKEGEFAPSCLMFHKVQDSFTEDYASIVERELTGKNGYTMKHGPYYLHENEAAKKGRWTIDELKEKAEFFERNGKDGNAMKTHLRRWLTDLHQNTGMAHQKVLRMKSVFDKDVFKKYIDDVTGSKCTPVYDILALHTIYTQQTKE